jgi:predicted dehydrogenase
MNEVRWGFVGAGTVAHHMAADLARAADTRLVAVTTRTRKTASQLAILHGARVIDTFDELITSPDIDAVYIATPPEVHAAQAIAAMQAGKAVLIEKPFALNSEEASAIVAVACETGRFCMEAMWTRFLPAVDDLRRRVAANELGEIRSFEADFSYAQLPNDNHHAFQLPGGGALLDRGVYGVSLAIDFFGCPTEVFSRASVRLGGVDEDVLVVMEHRNGVRSTITASLVSRGLNQAVVKGTMATAVLNEPFFATDRLSILPSVASTSGSRITASAPSQLVEKVRSTPLGMRLFETAKGLARASVREAKTQHVAKLGHGYAHQINAVVRALRAGDTTVDGMTPAASVDVMNVLDAARGEW